MIKGKAKKETKVKKPTKKTSPKLRSVKHDDSSALKMSLAFLKDFLEKRLTQYFFPEKMTEDFAYPDFKMDYDGSPFSKFVIENKLSLEEFVVLVLALVPHVQPGFLSQIINNTLEQEGDFPDLGGMKDTRNRGFLPTGETAMFLLSGNDFKLRFDIQNIFTGDHWLVSNSIISLEKVKDGEPFFNGKIILDKEYIELFTQGRTSIPELSAQFPAMKITTGLTWNDLVLHPKVLNQIKELKNWIEYNDKLLIEWEMAGKIKPGYRVLFHGPSGTGKTLTANLLGKYTNKEVFRVDLSMVVSKYIGETEKNLSKLFKKASNKNWILFFDEADSLFGKRTEVKDAHDRYANQEVSYLLQRVENYPGLVILSSNFKTNIDAAFARRFNAIIPFQRPRPAERLKIWEKAFPRKVTLEKQIDLRTIADKYELTGANIMNVVHFACLEALAEGSDIISLKMITEGIRKEFLKEDKVLTDGLG